MSPQKDQKNGVQRALGYTYVSGLSGREQLVREAKEEKLWSQRCQMLLAPQYISSRTEKEGF